MRILYHHRTLGDGAEGIHIKEMVKSFRKNKHDVKVISLIGEETGKKNEGQKKWTTISKLIPRVFYELGEIAYNVFGYREMSKNIKEFKPDFIYDRYISFNNSAVFAGKRYRLPVVLEVNSPYSIQREKWEKLYLKNTIKYFEKIICHGATIVVVVSTPLKEILISKGIPAEKIVVMPNGVDPDVFNPGIDGAGVRRELGIFQNLVYGFVGILRPWHQLEMLISSFEKLHRRNEKTSLIIVGDGPSEQSLKQGIKNTSVEKNVHFVGRVSHDKIREYVAAMDITISPHATFYSSPMKILEYMAMGKAVIAPAMRNIMDIIEDGENGILFEEGKEEALYEAMVKLMEQDDLRKRLGACARERIIANRTWDHNARDVIRLVTDRLNAN